MPWATVLAADVPGGDPDGTLDGALDGSSVVLTDGLRERERNFARIHDGASAALTPGDERRTGNPVRDYLSPELERWQSRVELEGARAVSASSSASLTSSASSSSSVSVTSTSGSPSQTPADQTSDAFAAFGHISGPWTALVATLTFALARILV